MGEGGCGGPRQAPQLDEESVFIFAGEKKHHPIDSFIDSDSDEEEEDYQLIIKHDWAAITYLDVRSFQLWLPSTTEVRNRPV